MCIVFLMHPQLPSPRRHALLFVLMAILFALLLTTHHLRLNPHPTSAPAGLYRIHRTPPTRGDLIVTCLPEHLSRFGRSRGYLDFGPCPGNARPVGKRLLALAGDRVTVTDEGLLLNGEPVPNTARRVRDSAGRFIPAVPVRTYALSPGQVWLVSDFDPRSWDSRYYGPVPLDGDAFVLTPLWLWRTAHDSPDAPR
jgi:conjugative transfer signal peptidase TraF